MPDIPRPDDDVRLMFDSKFIGAWDLMGQDVTVTIAKVVGGVVEGEKGRRDRAPLVSLKGWDKPLVLNKTNMKTVGAMYGFKVKDWVGKRVTLYATTCQGKGGGIVDCIRMRPQVPARPGVPQSHVGFVAVNQEMRRNQMVQAGETPETPPGPTAERQPGEDDE